MEEKERREKFNEYNSLCKKLRGLWVLYSNNMINYSDFIIRYRQIELRADFIKYQYKF